MSRSGHLRFLSSLCRVAVCRGGILLAKAIRSTWWPACVLVCLPGTFNASFAAERTPEVEASIRRGVTILKEDYLKNGSSTQLAAEGLLTYALLSAGESLDDPVVKKLIEKVAGKFDGSKYIARREHIYEAGTDAMALAAADQEKYRQHIQAIADYIIKEQRSYGAWDYPTGDFGGDTSISQYGMLGLWAAARTGGNVPRLVWDKAAAWHSKSQLPDGAFGYHPFGGEPAARHSMTVAGIGSLTIAKLYLYGQSAAVDSEPDAADVDDASKKAKKSNKVFGVLERVTPTEIADPPLDVTPKRLDDRNYKPIYGRKELDGNIGRGMTWLSKQYTIERPTGWPLYYLYGLERAAALTNTEKIGGHDWYQEGSEFLIRTQKSDGSWFDQRGPAPSSTCFALLFLSRATEKLVPNAPRPPPARRAATFGTGIMAGARGLPADLTQVDTTGGTVKAKTLDTPLDRLLADLENPKSQNVESAQAAIVETVITGNRAELIGQKDLLLKLVNDQRVEVRRTAYWALGRCNDLRVAPVLIRGLMDIDFDVSIEARNSLCVLSRRPRGFGLLEDALDKLPDSATPVERDAAAEKWRREDAQRWKEWYQSVRPYDERDNLPE
jgi:hypothetical protein